MLGLSPGNCVIGEIAADLYFSASSQINNVDSYGNLLAVSSNTGNQLQVVDLTTFGPPSAVTAGSIACSIAFNPSAIKFISSTKVLAAFAGTTTPCIFDLSAATCSTLSAADFGPGVLRSGAMACDTVNGIGIYCANAANKYTKVTLPSTVSSVTPSWATAGQNLTCVIFDGTNWAFGVLDGRVVVANGSGTLQRTITMPGNVIDGGTANKFIPDTLSLSGNTLYVSTAEGYILSFNYTTGALLKKELLGSSTTISNAGSSNNLVLGEVKGGLLPVVIKAPSSLGNLFLYDAAATEFTQIDYLTFDTNAVCCSAGINSDNCLMWLNAENSRLALYRIPDLSVAVALASTLAQEPAGSGIAGAIWAFAFFNNLLCRNIYEGTGNSSAAITYSVLAETLDYLEIAFNNATATSATKADARIYEG